MPKEIGSNIGSKKKRESQKAQVNKHEKEIAKKLGGFRTPNSGAFGGMKGDIKLEKFLLDSKETKESSIKISGLDLTKISREANAAHKIPGLYLTVEKIAFETPNEWVLIPADKFMELIDDN